MCEVIVNRIKNSLITINSRIPRHLLESKSMSAKLNLIPFIIIYIFFMSQLTPCEGRQIAPEDTLEITVYEHEDLSITTRVSSDGYISFPLLGSIHVEGLTVRKLEKKVAELLDKDFIVNPHVVVFTREYRAKYVYVMGEVNKPQAIDLSEKKGTTILEAISTAGGFTDKANLNKILIIRKTADGTKETIRIKLSTITKKGRNVNKKGGDIRLEPGDIILVSQRIF